MHVYNEQGLGPDNNQLLVTFDDEEDDGTPIRLVCVHMLSRTTLLCVDTALSDHRLVTLTTLCSLSV